MFQQRKQALEESARRVKERIEPSRHGVWKQLCLRQRVRNPRFRVGGRFRSRGKELPADAGFRQQTPRAVVDHPRRLAERDISSRTGPEVANCARLFARRLRLFPLVLVAVTVRRERLWPACGGTFRCSTVIMKMAKSSAKARFKKGAPSHPAIDQLMRKKGEENAADQSRHLHFHFVLFG